MEQKYIYRCEDSAEGIFTAIYDAWASTHTHAENRIEVDMEENSMMTLFSEYITVIPDQEKSRKVQRSIRSRISDEAYDMVMKTVLSQEPEKGEVIYRFLIYAFRQGASACRSYGNPFTMKLFEAVRNYDNEAHHLKGFLRFDEQKSGLLLARYAPKNNVLGELMVHFSDRLNPENFIIYDKLRKLAGIHEAHKDWFVYRLTDSEASALNAQAITEDFYSSLWKIFHKNISIEERTNLVLQRNNLPLRFRPYMTEFIL